jgi:SSS family solute:Na+ symporter
MVAAALYAPLIERFGSLFQYFQATLAYLVPPVVAVYFAGLLWRRATPAAGFWGLVGGLALGIVLFLTKEVGGGWQRMGLPTIHFTYMALLIFAATAALIAVISTTSPQTAPDDGARFRLSDVRPETSSGTRRWYGDYRIQALLLIGLMIAMILFAW